MKIDPYNNKIRFEAWMDEVEKYGIGLSRKNTDILLQFIKDSRLGLNISKLSKKGERSYSRLNHVKDKLKKMFELLEKRGHKDIKKLKSEDLHNLFSDMRSGKISTRQGTAYKSAGDYVKDFKTFWHWHQKVQRKKGNHIEDITEDLDTRGEKPKFVYFTEKDFEKILEKASYDTKPILALAFDSGARVTELANIRVSDFSSDFKELNIREETSKTFGRKIKLMLCSNQIKQYVEKVGLKPEDLLMQAKPIMINRELNKLGKDLLTSEQTKYKNLSLYDFRHSSACHWLPKYKSESSLKWRFGWKKSDMIHYYTELKGMKDTITEEDMYVDITKTELERKIKDLEDQMANKEKEIEDRIGKSLQKQFEIMKRQFEKLMDNPPTKKEVFIARQISKLPEENQEIVINNLSMRVKK